MGSVQLRWIAEAEARRVCELAVAQGVRSGGPIGVVWSEPAPLWRTWLLKTMSRVSIAPRPPVPPQRSRPRLV